jgi:hypothetical protein
MSASVAEALDVKWLEGIQQVSKALYDRHEAETATRHGACLSNPLKAVLGEH